MAEKDALMPMAAEPESSDPHAQDPMALHRIESAHESLVAEHGRLLIEHQDLKEKYANLEAKHDDVVRQLTELQLAHGLIAKTYEYKDDECRPVPPGGVCEKCGWNRDLQMKPGDKAREPHPVA